MKFNVHFFIAALLGGMLLLSSCAKEAIVLPGETVTEFKVDNSNLRIEGKVNGEQLKVDLLAGQTTVAGYVYVANDNDNLYVQFTTTSTDWSLEETHVYVGDLAAMPLTKSGNPKIGNFPYGEDDLMGANVVNITIPLSELGVVVDPTTSDPVAVCLDIAAHAVVSQVDATSSDPVIITETGWAAGSRINPQGNWATATQYCLQF